MGFLFRLIAKLMPTRSTAAAAAVVVADSSVYPTSFNRLYSSSPAAGAEDAGRWPRATGAQIEAKGTLVRSARVYLGIATDAGRWPRTTAKSSSQAATRGASSRGMDAARTEPTAASMDAGCCGGISADQAVGIVPTQSRRPQSRRHVAAQIHSRGAARSRAGLHGAYRRLSPRNQAERAPMASGTMATGARGTSDRVRLAGFVESLAAVGSPGSRKPCNTLRRSQTRGTPRDNQIRRSGGSGSPQHFHFDEHPMMAADVEANTSTEAGRDRASSGGDKSMDAQQVQPDGRRAGRSPCTCVGLRAGSPALQHAFVSTSTLGWLACLGLLLSLCTGCWSAKYEDAQGNRLTLSKAIWQEKIGRLEARSARGDVIIVEDLDSQSQMVKLMSEMNQTLKTFASIAGGIAK